LAAPVIIRTPGLLMPVRPILAPASGKFYLQDPANAKNLLRLGVSSCGGI
jgi:hypothetical protein